MCTAVSFSSKDHYFGRNLDLEYCYDECVTITPRNYPFAFRCAAQISSHYAMIGVATIADDYPLYYDATNEAGLSVAGLNFPGNAYYPPNNNNMNNIAPFELIPWILAQCKTVADTKNLLLKTNITAIPFSPDYPLSDLHWIVADQKECIAIEPTKDGLQIISNPIGILTNNPPLSYHLQNLYNYINLSDTDPENHFLPSYPLKPNSRGMGGMGLPGDLSSQSRFIRAAFTKFHSVKPKEEHYAVNQFFQILRCVSQQEGCVKVGNAYEKTVYSSCCNTNQCIYYYTTYENSQITAVHLKHEDLNASQFTFYPLLRTPQIREEN